MLRTHLPSPNSVRESCLLGVFKYRAKGRGDDVIDSARTAIGHRTAFVPRVSRCQTLLDAATTDLGGAATKLKRIHYRATFVNFAFRKPATDLCGDWVELVK